MRRMKFRAWCSFSDDMCDYLFICSDGDVYGSASLGYNTPNTEIEEDSTLTVMQFTGLKDRNGKEIYEGDILFHHLQGYSEVIYPMSENIACFGLLSSSGKKNVLQDSENLYEVAGNIYENRYLLEQA